MKYAADPPPPLTAREVLDAWGWRALLSWPLSVTSRFGFSSLRDLLAEAMVRFPGYPQLSVARLAVAVEKDPQARRCFDALAAFGVELGALDVDGFAVPTFSLP